MPSNKPPTTELCEVELVHPKRVDRVRSALPDQDALVRISEIFRACSGDTRLQLLLALAQEELCVCDLAATVGASPSGVSHHLRYLRALHLVHLARRMLSRESWSLPVVAVRNDFSLMASTSDGVVVTFGMYGHDRQLGDLKKLQRHAMEMDRGIERVNLIPERNIPVVYLPGSGEGLQKVVPRRENRLERDIKAILNRS